MALGIGLLVATAAGAQTTFHVKDFDVQPGQWTFESITAVQDRFPADTGRFRSGHEIGLGYGVSSFYFAKVLIDFDKPVHDGWRLQRLVLENIFRLSPLPLGVDGWGLAWFQSIEGRLNRHETNASLFGPIITVQSGKFSATLNPFIEKTFGANSVEGLALVAGWQTRVEIATGLALGIEGYSNIPDIDRGTPQSQTQQHRIGPMLIADVELGHGSAHPAQFELGVQFGLTEATPDVTGKVNMQMKF